VIGAAPAEIDLAAKVWTVPAARTKRRREHRVPLSKRALEILGALPREGELVFPGARDGKQLSHVAMLKVLERMGRDDVTVHGFRSTFRDWCAETTNYPGEVAEQALAHLIPDKVEAAYRRGDLFEKRRRLMSEWAAFCGRVAPHEPGMVAALGRA
jgi:integrase